MINLAHRTLSLLLLLLLSVSLVQAQPEAALRLADENGNFTTVDNAQIYYISEGNPQDPAVMLIHGFGGSTVTWRETLPALAEAGFYAVALDLPPFGLSDKSTDLTYTRAQMADWTAALMDELGIEEAVIVGHSMGGAVTAQFAVRHAERVQGLVFVAGAVPASRQMTPTPEPDNSDDEDDSPLSLLDDINPNSPFAAAALRFLFTEDRFADMLSSAYAEDYTVSEETLQAYMRPLQLDNWPQGFLAYLGADNRNPVTASDLSQQVDKPVLILWGEADTWVPPQVGQALHEVLSGSQLMTYENVGHLPMEEVPQQFNEDLIAFVQRVQEP
jgi:pimeloyl-ACP methyl ester carboxylesterase